MNMSVTELAALPTAPTVSEALREAARYADEGPFLAVRRAMFGSITYESFIGVITTAHAIAESVAIIALGKLIDPDVSDELPDESWDVHRSCAVVGVAHRTLAAWAENHTAQDLALLFLATADCVRAAEQNNEGIN